MSFCQAPAAHSSLQRAGASACIVVLAMLPGWFFDYAFSAWIRSIISWAECTPSFW